MNYVTTTDLRTKSKDILKALEEGQTINIIHRSKIVGEIRPSANVNLKTIDASRLEDNIRLHSAAENDCNFFLTLDKQLIKMKFFGKMQIISPDNFTSLLP